MQVTVAEYLPISIAVCLPDTCKPYEFVDIFNNSSFIPPLNKSGIGFNVTALTCKAKSLELSTGGIVTLCIMSVFFLLVFMGSSITAFKYFAHSNASKDECKSSVNEGKVSEYFVGRSLEELLVINEGSPTKLKAFIDMCDPVLNCFCIFTNGSKLFNTDSTEGQLLCLHGIRFLSLTWVIVCHVYMSPIAQIRSTEGLLPLIDNFPFQAILNGWYSVDSFFVLSGFLMSYLYFQECAKKQGKTPWLYFYVHRYLRLTPVYMIVLAFYATVMPIIGSGPFWQDYNVDPHCQKGWWWNLIYINNFRKQSEQCMGWSWYLANDMQFFAISPLFLITLWRWPKVGYSMLLLFLWGSWLSGFLITYHYDLIAGTMSYIVDIEQVTKFSDKWMEYFDKIYIKPYTRIAPYLIGIGLGYILFKRKVTDIKVNRVTLWIGWLLAIPVGLYCVYGLYHQTPNLVAASFFNALTRTGYGLSLSWLIFVCISGQAGVVDKILSYKLFIPLSRLTYCAYLIHVIVISLYIFSRKTTIVFTHQTIILMFLGLLIVTYALSVLVSLTFESPLIRLEKLIRSKFQNR
ncbi:nose resistant to fluoxetine protein 6 [Parasteatoda tepidariorum]|uniref:nose resistant to fluoxetine protein 6 n=1 Tax=Parasteatoda tepidariorum TaxID=114398 RepID=UPI001C726E49|nr:nose resistant to fluoxetine protein 6 [Parasteatoda tepidariorum]